MPLNSKKLYDKIDYLRVINQEQMIDRSRIRDIMNGGADGLKALLGKSMRDMDYQQIPAPNLLMSALDRLAQKLGRAPDLKVDIFKLREGRGATPHARPRWGGWAGATARPWRTGGDRCIAAVGKRW